MSRNTTPPWSRRRATQPARVTVDPASDARSVPASWLRSTWLPFSGRREGAAAATGSRSPCHGGTDDVEQLPDLDRVLLAAAQVLELPDAVGQVALADDHGVRRPGPVGGLHGALEPAVAVDGVR